jgi:hypothetical protein
MQRRNPDSLSRRVCPGKAATVTPMGLDVGGCGWRLAEGVQNKLKKVLVLLADLVKVTPTMKRIYTLIVLLGLVMGAVLTGCNQGPTENKPEAGTNAPTPPPASTNK